MTPREMLTLYLAECDRYGTAADEGNLHIVYLREDTPASAQELVALYGPTDRDACREWIGLEAMAVLKTRKEATMTREDARDRLLLAMADALLDRLLNLDRHIRENIRGHQEELLEIAPHLSGRPNGLAET